MVSAVLDGVAKDLPLEGEPDSSDKLKESDGYWKNRNISDESILAPLYHVGPYTFLFRRITIAVCSIKFVCFVLFSHLIYMSIIP